MKFTAVIPLSNQSIWNNWEVQYCIRSIRKHALFINDIVTIGMAIPGIRNIPHQDTQHPATNIWEKLAFAAMDTETSDRFMVISDDHILTYTWTGNERPTWAGHRLADFPARPRWNGMVDPYEQLIRRTEQLVGNIPFVQNHEPWFAEKFKIINSYKKHFDAIATGCGILVKSTYMHDHGLPLGMVMDDYKAKPDETFKGIERQSRLRDCVSLGPEVSDGVAKWLFQTFGPPE